MRISFLICLLLIGINVAVFGQLGDHEFVVMDDPRYVSGNPHVRTGLTWDSVRWAFREIHDANWIPLTWISLMIDADLHGDNAGGFHRTSLAIHILNTLLLFLVLRQATGADWKSGIVAALFAVHPLHVESVAWLPERKDVLSTLFGLLAMLVYVRYARRPAAKWYLLLMVLYACSLLSKQMLVTLPFVLLLVDFWPLRRFGAGNGAATDTQTLESPPDRAESAERIDGNSTRENGNRGFPQYSWKLLILEKLPLLLLAVAFSAIVFFAQREGGAVRSLNNLPLSVRLANAAIVYVLYIAKMFWPVNLAIFYPHPGEDISYTLAAAAAALLIAVTVVVLIAARRYGYLAVGWLWYLGTLVPVIGLVQIGGQRMADRYTYIPLIGLFIALTWLAAELLSKVPGRKFLGAVLTIGAIAALGIVAWRQTGYWQSSEPLFRHALAVTGDNAVARINLGTALYEQGERDEAREHFEMALEIEPRNAIAHNNLGTLLHTRGDLAAAGGHFDDALRLNPRYAEAYVNLANLRRDQGRAAEAINLYERALEIEPDNFAALTNLANLLREAGRVDEAVAYLSRAAELEPENVTTLTNLGITLHLSGQGERAMSYLQEAVQRDPDSPQAQYNLGVALFSHRQYDAAARQFARVLQLDEDHQEARESLAASLLSLGALAAQQGRLPTATRLFKRAHNLAPGDWRTSYNLATAYLQSGRLDEALPLLERSLELNADSAEVQYQLGRLKLEQGDREAAIAHFRAALELRPEFTDARTELDRLLQPE